LTSQSLGVSFYIITQNIIPIFFQAICLLDASPLLLQLDKVLDPESIDSDAFCFYKTNDIRKSRGTSIVLVSEAQIHHFFLKCFVNQSQPAWIQSAWS
jgi:hypothetical protein